MPSAAPLASAFRLIPRASDGVLTARWLPRLPAYAARSTYADPLTAASHFPNRQFWLFDLRGCTPTAPAAGQWFADAFAVRTFCTPGQPVYVAYVFDDNHPAVMGCPIAATTQRAYRTHGLHVACFVQEAAARIWLRRQQTRVSRSVTAEA